MVQGEWNACVFKKTDDISGVIEYKCNKVFFL